jgi:hypothetical protein
MLRDLEEYLATSGQLASRLKLGEWIATSFGTELVERRRASERRLPKSMPPPPRPSAPARAGAERPGSSPAIPPAPALPRPRLASEIPVSDGAMRAFKRELESGPSRLTLEPGSLAGSAIDVAPSSGDPAPPGATGRASSPEVEAVVPRRNPAPPFGAVVVLLVIVAALVALARFFVQ